MNVFVLNTGRCGSTTFIKACSHISNYSAGHESRIRGFIGEARLQYPQNHIEADNRLSWFLGRLERAYGDDARYVHLGRSIEETARSFVKRYHSGIINAYREQILRYSDDDIDPMAVAMDYLDTVNSNIELFAKKKSNWMSFSLEGAKGDFRTFWDFIGAEGDLEAALAEFDIKHNASHRPEHERPRRLLSRISSKILRVFKNLPAFIKHV